VHAFAHGCDQQCNKHESYGFGFTVCWHAADDVLFGTGTRTQIQEHVLWYLLRPPFPYADMLLFAQNGSLCNFNQL
jgi:hypothetical protein